MSLWCVCMRVCDAWGLQASPTTNLLDAAAKGDVERVINLIAGGADVGGINASGNKAIHIAAYEGHVKVLEALLARGKARLVCELVPPSYTADLQPSTSAVLCRVRLLCRLRPALDWKTSCPHVSYCWAGALVNDVGRGNNTPLHYAARNNHVEAVKFLMGVCRWTGPFHAYTHPHTSPHARTYTHTYTHIHTPLLAYSHPGISVCPGCPHS